MQIVIIGGLPCSGKSILAERLRKRWVRPLLSKDDFKESLFGSLGGADRAWSRRISVAAYDLLFRQAEELARCGLSFIVEGNFRERDHRRCFERLAAHGPSFVQVHCHALPEILVNRFAERTRANARHAGHADQESLLEITEEIRTTKQLPLSVQGDLIECDTTEEWSVAIDSAIDRALVKLSSKNASVTN